MQDAVLDPDRDDPRHGVDVAEEDDVPGAVADAADGVAGGVDLRLQATGGHLPAEVGDGGCFVSGRARDRDEALEQIDVALDVLTAGERLRR